MAAAASHTSPQCFYLLLKKMFLKVERWLLGAEGEGNGDLLFSGYSFDFAKRKSSGVLLYNTVKTLNTTELYP